MPGGHAGNARHPTHAPRTGSGPPPRRGRAVVQDQRHRRSQACRDVLGALEACGVAAGDLAAAGVRVLKRAMASPVVPSSVLALADGCDEILVVEDEPALRLVARKILAAFAPVAAELALSELSRATGLTAFSPRETPAERHGSSTRRASTRRAPSGAMR